MKTKEQIIDEILNRGVIVDILPSREEFKHKLMTEKLRFFIGADPTNTSLHLSHAKNFMLLEEFRKLGHEVIVLFGDFTACIGDPSDRNSARARLTPEQVHEFSADWVRQISPIINFNDPVNPARVVFNGDWLNKLTMRDLIELASNTTVQHMLERDMFQKRMAENRAIHLHEFLYPIFQGFDSVALDADVEMCGIDQTFNALMGRTLLKKLKNKEKFIVCNNLMENPITGELMSKSRGTGVFLNTDANTMFGQIMAQPDEMIRILLVNNTRVPLADIDALDIEHNPMDAKLFTAHKIVEVFHGTSAANSALEHFKNTFSNKVFPANAPEFTTERSELSVMEILQIGMPAESKTELRRLVLQNAVAINDVKVNNANDILPTNNALSVRVGRKTFFKIVKK
ncbi:MAG: tyrosine--tRNA ligase [Alphaproteobacteria bacterium]|nr:tyrosine--tRNA ligase [Alphaproteobacteria bacterium]MBR4806852.1 tyrosine--tRNA ligase [Alphaproteobacteria bacterium]